MNWRVGQEIDPAVSQAQRQEQRGQHTKNEQDHEGGRETPAQITDAEPRMRLKDGHDPLRIKPVPN